MRNATHILMQPDTSNRQTDAQQRRYLYRHNLFKVRIYTNLRPTLSCSKCKCIYMYNYGAQPSATGQLLYSLYKCAQTTKLLKRRAKKVCSVMFYFKLFCRHLKSIYSLRVITTILGFMFAGKRKIYCCSFNVDFMLLN